MDLERLLAFALDKRVRRTAYLAYAVVNLGTMALFVYIGLTTGSWSGLGGWLTSLLVLWIPLGWLHFEVAYRVSKRDGQSLNGSSSR